MRRRRGNGIVEGALVVVGMLVVPVALASALRAPVEPGLATPVVVLVAVATTAWLIVAVSLVRTVHDTLRLGEAAVDPGPIGWAAVRVASLVLLVAPFLELGSGSSSPGRGARPADERTVSVVSKAPSTITRPPRVSSPAGERRGHTHSPERRRGGHRGQGRPAHSSTEGAILAPLAAGLRRRRRMTGRLELDDETAIDAETELLATPPSTSVSLTSAVRSLAASGRLKGTAVVVLRDGEVELADGSWTFDPTEAQADVRCLVVPLGESAGGTYVAVAPIGAELALGGVGATQLLDDSLRVAPAIELGRPVRATATCLTEALALREDGELVVCIGRPEGVPAQLVARSVVVCTEATDPLAVVGSSSVTLASGQELRREILSPVARRLLDGVHDRPVAPRETPVVDDPALLRDDGIVVRLLTAVPRVDGLLESLEPGRERRAVELVAYLALRAGEPVTGERLRMRVLGSSSSDAAAKTLFNVASMLRRSLGEGTFGPRLPPAGRVGRYAVAKDVACDVTLLEARAAKAQRCDEIEERIAWLRAALELIESEPFATVLEGYDWFLTEGHLSRLQVVCEEAACELVDLALERGLVPLARFAIDRARLVDPYSEPLSAAAARVEAARQASLDAIAPALRSTEPSAPTLT